MNRWEPESESFSRYFHEEGDLSSLTGNWVHDLFVDSKSQLWVVTDEGINLYLPESDTFEPVYLELAKDVVVDFSSICEDQDGDYWIANSGVGLVQYRQHEGVIDVFYNDDYAEHDAKLSNKKLLVDSKNQLWVGGVLSGLQKFDKEKHTFTNIPNCANGMGLNGARVWDLLEYPEGQLLIALNQGGLNRMCLETGEISYQNSHSRSGYDLAGDGTTCLHLDNEGILWIGSSRSGLDYSNPMENRFETLSFVQGKPDALVGRTISSFFEDSEGFLWIGSDGAGISIWNRQTNVMTNIRPDDENPLIDSGTIRNFVEDEYGRFWVSTWDAGVTVLQKQNGKIVRLTEFDERLAFTKEMSIWTIYIDQKNRFWVLTTDGDVFGYDQDFIQFYSHQKGQLDADYTPAMEEIKNIGLIYSYADELSVFNEETQTFDLLFETPNATVVRRDEDGNFYTGTIEHGVYQYDSEGYLLKHLTREDGLSDNLIASLEIDLNGKLWISTNSGLDSYEPISGKVKSYGERDGLSGNLFFPEASIRMSSGEICFGGSSGLTIFDPSKLLLNPHAPAVFINEVRINGSKVNFRSENAAFNVQPHYVKEIELEWNENYLGFSFGAVSMTFPYRNQYAYMMEGLDEDWTYVDSSQRSASYASLPPGEYKFRVKASNNDEVWNENGTSISIVIHPPFWETPWFYAFITLVCILLIVILIKLRERIHIRDKQNLERKVFERTRMIEEQKHELQIQGRELLRHQHQLEEIVDERTNELMVAKDQAEKSNKLKSHFLANLSHEIRTPLNAIVGLSGFLGEKDLDDKEREEFLSAISKSSDSLLRLIEDILDFSMLETGQLEVCKEDVDLNEFLSSLYVSNVANARHQNVQLVLENKLNKSHLHLHTDSRRLNQIIENLLSNAVKFTPEGKVVYGARREENKLVFFVADEGPGIPESMQDAIFEEFTKLEKHQVMAMRGVGLGLAICNRLASLLGGKLTLDSEEGKGSTFCLSFPVDVLSSNSTFQNNTTEDKLTKGDWSSCRFLIIEDEYTNFLFLNEVLKRNGAKADHAETGERGLEMLSAEAYDIVFLDIQMPGMDGYETLRRIRKLSSSIKVISQTAFSFPEDREKIIKAGFDQNLWKPIKSEVVEKVVSELIVSR